MLPLPTVALLTQDEDLADSATLAIWEAGAAVLRLDPAAAFDRSYLAGEVPPLAVCGRDIAPQVAAEIQASWPKCQMVKAAMGERSSLGGEPCMVLPGATPHLVRLIEQVCASPRRAKRLALIGAHGGAATSSLAVATALRLGRIGPCRLAALNPAGARIEPLLGLEDVPGWETANLAVEQQLAVPCKSSSGVSLISGSGPPPTIPPWQIRAVVESWEAQNAGGWTVLDGGAGSLGGAWRLVSWADCSVILARNDPAGAATLRSIAEEVRAFGLAFIVAVRQVRGGLSSEQMARAGGVADVIALGEERGLMAGLAHGVLPGERITGPLAAAADALLKVLAAPKQPAPNSDRNPYPAVQTKPSRLPDQAASDLMEPSSLPPEDAATWRPGTLAACDTGQTKRTSRPRHRRTKTLPAFNPAAFAEEW